MLTKPNHYFSLSSDGLFADTLPAITAYSLRKQRPWFLWKETAPFIRRFWIKRFGSNITYIFTIMWFHNSTVAHPFLISFRSMTIASIQDFPTETFEHGFEIDVEHAEFHSYSSSVFFFSSEMAIMLLRKSMEIERTCKGLHSFGSSRKPTLITFSLLDILTP